VAVLWGGLLGALLLLVAEFTTLYEVNTAASPTPIKSVAAGSQHTYALIPIALLVAVLAYGAWHDASRPALLAIGVLGVATLLIAVIGDLPDASATGITGSPTTRLMNASSSPGLALYMETLGAAILIMTSGVAFLLAGPPRRDGAAGLVDRR
jgi:hypothetical protein